MNFWGFHPEVFDLAAEMFDDFVEKNYQNIKAEFFIPLVVTGMIQQGKGKVKVLDGGTIWFGVTYQEDKDAVSKKIRELVAKGLYPEKLW